MAPKEATILSQLNCNSNAELGFYLPESMEDNTDPIYVFDATIRQPGKEGLFIGIVTGKPLTKWSNGRPRLLVFISDGENSIGFSLFGDQRELEKDLVTNPRIAVKGIVHIHNGQVYLNDARLEPLESVGSIRPVYAGIKSKISSKRVTEFISENIDINASCIYLTEELKNLNVLPIADRILKEAGFGIQAALQAIHYPVDLSIARRSYKALKRIAILHQAALACEQVSRESGQAIVGGMSIADLIQLAPFRLTEEQQTAVENAIRKMQSGLRFRGMLVGDVGSGKTVVYGLIAAYVLTSGRNKRVAVMLPSEPVAKQVFTELRELMPFVSSVLVTGNSREEGLSKYSLLVGTTALLHRDLGGGVDFSVIDEQHKSSVSQREALVTTKTHTLEVSATPMPRSMALATYGAVDVLTLKHTHTPKQIITRIVRMEQADWLFNEVKDTLRRGAKVLIVCPRRSDQNNKDKTTYSAETIANAMHSHFPGQVRMVHSEQTAQESDISLTDIKEGRATILVATTRVEVGITIPELRHVILYGAERFGLTTSHQLRGRLARIAPRGGGLNWGKCDLFLPNEKVNEKTLQRLQVLIDSNDGFEISEKDMRLRGVGDIEASKDRQHGRTNSLIKNIKLPYESVGIAVEFLSNRFKSLS